MEGIGKDADSLSKGISGPPRSRRSKGGCFCTASNTRLERAGSRAPGWTRRPRD